MTDTSLVLERSRSPAQWCDVFAEKGIPISERTLRLKARQLGACHVIGHAMLITPEQIDLILEDSACRSKHTREAKHGGPKGGSNTTGSPSPITSGKALEHLRKLARGSGSPTGRRLKNAATC